MTLLIESAALPQAEELPDPRPRRRWTDWHSGLTFLTVASATVYLGVLKAGLRSEYYSAIALSMSKSLPNFLLDAADPAGRVSLDKIFGFSAWSVPAPNAIAAVAAVVIIAVTVKRISGPTAGLIAGALVATTPILSRSLDLTSPSRSSCSYNGHVRFTTTTAAAGTDAYCSFTPPLSVPAGVFRLVNAQLAGQIAWLLPAAIAAIVILVILRTNRAQVVLVPTAAASAVLIGLMYLDYLAWLPAVQMLVGIAAVIALIVTGRIRAVRTVWVAVLLGVSLMLTPAVWAVDVINHPNSINHVAGSGSAMFGAMVADPYITATGDDVLPIGGFDGQDQTPTLAAFQDLVSQGQLRFVLAGAMPQTGGQIGDWVGANRSKVTYSMAASTVLYDCEAK